MFDFLMKVVLILQNVPILPNCILLSKLKKIIIIAKTMTTIKNEKDDNNNNNNNNNNSKYSLLF